MSTSTEEVKISTESSNQPDNDYVKWRKAKKVAVMASFVGKDYLGMQRYELHSVAKVYAVLPFYDVKCLCSGGRE